MPGPCRAGQDPSSSYRAQTGPGASKGEKAQPTNCRVTGLARAFFRDWAVQKIPGPMTIIRRNTAWPDKCGSPSSAPTPPRPQQAQLSQTGRHRYDAASGLPGANLSTDGDVPSPATGCHPHPPSLPEHRPPTPPCPFSLGFTQIYAGAATLLHSHGDFLPFLYILPFLARHLHRIWAPTVP